MHHHLPSKLVERWKKNILCEFNILQGNHQLKFNSMINMYKFTATKMAFGNPDLHREVTVPLLSDGESRVN